MNKLTNILVDIYQKLFSTLLSLLFGKGCRFEPTCSQYCKIAFAKHNTYKATKLTLRRVSKCHPWGGYGFDPVPEK